MGSAYLKHDNGGTRALNISMRHVSFILLTMSKLGFTEIDKWDLSFSGDYSDYLSRVWLFFEAVMKTLVVEDSLDAAPVKEPHATEYTHIPIGETHASSRRTFRDGNSLKAITLEDLKRRQLAKPFVGRDYELSKIRLYFETDVDVQSAPIVTICGLPGVGKTALSIRYALESHKEFQGFCWCCDVDRNRLIDDFAQFAAFMGVAPSQGSSQIDSAMSAIEFLAQPPRRSLMIIDNACHPDEICDLVLSANVFTIVTSRFREWKRYGRHVDLT